MGPSINLENIAVVLCGPRYPENIGAAARSMRNMGLSSLLVVKPRQLDMTRVRKMATHAAGRVVEQMLLFDSLDEALAPFNFVVGTTARLGRQRQVISNPAELALKLVPISQTNRVALLFGPEDRGLSNEDLRRCHWLVNIPTSDFSSINLAQAVMIICYELHRAVDKSKGEFVPQLANRHQLDGMYEQLKDILLRIDYIKPDNPDYWMNRLRHFFTRMQLRAREVSIIRGICRQIDWHAGKCYEEGKKSRKEN